MEREDVTRALTQSETHRDLDTVVSSINFGRFHIKMLILTCGAYFAACAEMLLIVFLSKPVKDEWELDDMMFPLLPFCCGIVSFVSSFTFGSLSDKYGRQTPLLVALGLVSLFGIASAFAPYFSIFVVLRALVSAGTSGIETVNFVLLLGLYTDRRFFLWYSLTVQRSLRLAQARNPVSSCAMILWL